MRAICEVGGTRTAAAVPVLAVCASAVFTPPEPGAGNAPDAGAALPIAQADSGPAPDLEMQTVAAPAEPLPAAGSGAERSAPRLLPIPDAPETEEHGRAGGTQSLSASKRGKRYRQMLLQLGHLLASR